MKSFKKKIKEENKANTFKANGQPLKAIQRCELQRLKTIAIATRAASAKNNDFDKFVSGLDG